MACEFFMKLIKSSLSKQYAQLSSAYSEREKKQSQEIANQLKEISKLYAKDEKFNSAIEGNDLTKSVKNSLLEIDTLERDRGFER